MNVKRIVIILIALVTAGLVYVGVDRYRSQESSDVIVQEWLPRPIEL